MNILFLMGVYPSYGGVEKVSTILANEFIRKGHNVSIVSFKQPNPELAAEELNEGVVLYKLSFPVYSKKNLLELKRIISNNGIDILINQWCVPYYVTRLCRQAMKGTNCKLIAVHHNMPDTNARIKAIEIAIAGKKGLGLINRLKLFLVKSISRLSLRYVYERSDQFVVLSPNFMPVAQKYIFKGRTEKMSFIPNPITIDSPESDNLVKQQEIIYVGRIEDNQKRTFRLVEIWEKLEPEFPSWHFTIVGSGPNRQDLENLIKRSKLQNISIEGFQNPRSYYERSSILVLTSEYEGFGLVVVEGMNYGVVPVVLGSYVAIHDIVRNYRSGIIVPYPYSRDNFVEHLRGLMLDHELRERMSREAIIESRRFEREAIVNEWITLFHKLS